MHDRCCKSSSTSSWSCWRWALHHTSYCQSKSSCSSSSSSCLFVLKKVKCKNVTYKSYNNSDDWYRCAACRPTHAVVPAVNLHVVHRADAGVVPDGVVALAWATDSWSFALVDVCTHRGQTINLLFEKYSVWFTSLFKMYNPSSPENASTQK